MDRLKYISADDYVRAIADLRQRDENNRISEKTVAEEKGKAEGLAEGENKKAVEVAKNLLKMGLNIEQVSEATGLSPDEVKKFL